MMLPSEAQREGREGEPIAEPARNGESGNQFPFTLCLKCHDRTRFASIKSNQSFTTANLSPQPHWPATVISTSGKPSLSNNEQNLMKEFDMPRGA
jgi:hypothetical protein